MGKLEGKTALITGAAGGIGRAMAKGFAAEGAHLWLTDIAEEGLTAAAAGLGDHAQAVVMDVRDGAVVDRVVSDIDARAGGIDILVNCAGIYALEPWLEITVDCWDRIFAVNTRGMVLATQAVARTLVARRRPGSVVNIASAAGRRGDAGSAAYSASKAAAISITQSAALALAPHRIRVNAIAPGPVDTPMWADVLASRRERQDHSMEAITSSIPLGRISAPAEQVGAAIFLASEDSTYVTGQTLNVDGGLYLN